MPTHIAFRTTRVPIAAVMGATVLAWVGFYVHNIADLPAQSLLSPETLYPTVVTIGCLAVLLVPATRAAGSWLLLGWTTLNLLGGALSVLPLPFLPFVPEQSFRHYAFHALYALCLLPLLWLCICLVRRSSLNPLDNKQLEAHTPYYVRRSESR